MPRAQFTIRRLMIAVAVIASLLGAGMEAVRLRKFRSEYLSRAQFHASSEQSSLSLTKAFTESAVVEEGLAARDENQGRAAELFSWAAQRSRNNAIYCATLAAYHAGLKEKYRRAADQPWRYIEPDALEPAASR